MVRFLHTSDWQLGMRRHFLGDEAQARFDQARIDAIQRICQAARKHDCAFIVVAGDVFESNHLDPRTIARTLEALQAADRPLLLLPGNHDPLDPASIFTRPAFRDACPANVHVLAGDPFEPLPGVEVHGAPWRSKNPGADLVASTCAALEPAKSGATRILVAHGQVSSLAMGSLSPNIIDQPAAEAALRDGRIHFLALGDRHSTYAVGDSRRIWYSGAPEPTDYDEDDPGNVLVVDVDPGACDVRPAHVGTWAFVNHHADLNSDADLDGLATWLADLPAKERTIVQLALKGSLSLEQHGRLERDLEQATLAFAAIEHWDRHSDLAIAPGDDDLERMALGGYACEALTTLLEQARDAAADDHAARDALTLLHRLSRSTA